VAHQLRVLEAKGLLRKDANRPRALVVSDTESVDVTGLGASFPTAVNVPVLGRIAAGGPILAEEAVETVFPLPHELVGDGQLFMLKVVGESMIDAAICDGDFVVIRQQPSAENGDIVAALLGDEATVKTFTTTCSSQSPATTHSSLAKSWRSCAVCELGVEAAQGAQHGVFVGRVPKRR
jgi:repressor LexA